MREPWIGLLVCSALLGPGCKDKAAPSPGSSASATAAPAVSAPEPAAAPAAASPFDDACTVFTRDVAKGILDAEVAGPEHGLGHLDHQRDSCEWQATGDAKKTARGTVAKHAYACDTFVAEMKKEYTDALVVDGLGKAAVLVRAGSLGLLQVCTDAASIVVSASVADDKLRWGAAQVLEKLPK